ncbi:hypothetical protein DFH29DRAFT_229017 [Suillus ampliporus]|nr:hypothetical protein DFH29DRAFT_229017 [Suillus ampliporus]
MECKVTDRPANSDFDRLVNHLRLMMSMLLYRPYKVTSVCLRHHAVRCDHMKTYIIEEHTRESTSGADSPSCSSRPHWCHLAFHKYNGCLAHWTRKSPTNVIDRPDRRRSKDRSKVIEMPTPNEPTMRLTSNAIKKMAPLQYRQRSCDEENRLEAMGSAIWTNIKMLICIWGRGVFCLVAVFYSEEWIFHLVSQKRYSSCST